MTENKNKYQTKSGLKSELGIIGFFVVLFIVPFIISAVTGSGVNDGMAKYWEGLLISFFIMAVFAMSYDLLMGYSGILSFGHAAFFGVGAYTNAILLRYWAPTVDQINLFGNDVTIAATFIVSVLASIITAILVGLLFSATSVRLKGTYFAMLTLALGNAIHIISKATDFLKYTGADEGLHGVPTPFWLNPTQHRFRFYIVALIFMIICYFIMKRFVKSPTGHVVQAVRENESRARMIGYNPAVYRTITFVVSAVFAGLAGVLYSLWNMSATPSMTSAILTIDALIMVILGGMGTLIGPIFGAGIMEILGHFLYDWFGARWPLVFGIIFVLIVLFIPHGIVGTYRQQSLNIQKGWQRFAKMFKTKTE